MNFRLIQNSNRPHLFRNIRLEFAPPLALYSVCLMERFAPRRPTAGYLDFFCCLTYVQLLAPFALTFAYVAGMCQTYMPSETSMQTKRKSEYRKPVIATILLKHNAQWDITRPV